jgi:hypothetical protein
MSIFVQMMFNIIGPRTLRTFYENCRNSVKVQTDRRRGPG